MKDENKPVPPPSTLENVLTGIDAVIFVLLHAAYTLACKYVPECFPSHPYDQLLELLVLIVVMTPVVLCSVRILHMFEEPGPRDMSGFPW